MGSRENGRSRIKWLQVAIMKQLKDLKEKFPNSKVGLVTFNGGLFVIGDGSKEKVFYDGQCLYNFEMLKQNGEAQANQRLENPIRSSFR